MDVGMLRQAGRPVEDGIFRYFDQQRQQWFGQSCPRRGGYCAVVLTDSVKVQTRRHCVSVYPSRIEDGVKDGAQSDPAAFWSGAGLEVKSV